MSIHNIYTLEKVKQSIPKYKEWEVLNGDGTIDKMSSDLFERFLDKLEIKQIQGTGKNQNQKGFEVMAIVKHDDGYVDVPFRPVKDGVSK